jgi:hypothetical protein
VTATPDDAATRPFLQLVRGSATDAELAAVAVVLLSRRGGGESAPARRRSAWGSPARAVRPVLRPGVDAWRASSLPR